MRCGSLAISAALATLIASCAPLLAFEAFDPNGSGPQYPTLANGRVTNRPAIAALRVGGDEIAIDGKLDEGAWLDAESGFGFTEADPNRGEVASEETVFKIVYDEDAFYFGVACYEQDVANTSVALTRRDRLDNCDQISIYVDPYHDRTTGYNFRVNPDGVQMDQYVFNDGDRDLDWNAVWNVETSMDERGWYAEFRIPFSVIRYSPAESMTWGLQVYRWMHGRGEDTAWVNWERNARGFVSRFGSITGLEGVKAPRQLEVLPYIAGRITDTATGGAEDNALGGIVPFDDNFGNLGADLKYGVTANLTLNATVQPDFGQVEADPAVLNLSPFETFFEEKRPFFIEGSRFFQHPDFNLVYTRRIGTGDENARIRAAGKLTGKSGMLKVFGDSAPDLTMAAMFAATDVTNDGQAHNLFKQGNQQAYYGVVRTGVEFDEGNHRFNVMGTMVVRDEAERITVDDNPRLSRDGYSGGFDFDLNFKDRMYNIQGSMVGTIVDDAPVLTDDSVRHDARHGTGGRLDIHKVGGTYRGGVSGGWEHDKLDPNDLGILSAPDEYSTSAWAQRRFNWDDDTESFWNQGNVNLNFFKSWLYADRSFDDPDETSDTFGDTIWSYGEGKPQSTGGNINGWMETKERWSVQYGVWHDAKGLSRFVTRGGPPMTTPQQTGFWFGGNTDWRKTLKFDGEIEGHWSVEGKRYWELDMGMNWVQSQRLNHNLDFSFSTQHLDAQWVDNVSNAGAGIGGVSHVFGELDNNTFDITLRSNVLFARNSSLELYLQPFITTLDYRQPRELATADSYDLRPFAADDFDINDFDTTFGAVNVNAVYRWEYQPGSTLFLVWSHSRDRGAALQKGDDVFSLDPLFKNEPVNTFLAKLTYWFSI